MKHSSHLRSGRVSMAWLITAFLLISGLARAAVDQVIVVFKTHFDIGYTDMASNVVQRYRTRMIDDALSVVDQNRDLPPEQQFVWTLPGWPLTQIMEDWTGQTPTRQQRIRSAFRSGRFVVHALPFTTHTELLQPEDLVRGLDYSARLARQASLPLPRDAKMTDVPSHSWILPTLLRHAGVDFLHLGCNAASRSPRVPPLFWWEGPDGSRLLTMYTAESYGTGLVPPPEWPYRTWLALTHTGDNHGPPRPDEVKQLLEQAKAKLPDVKVRIGRLSDFADGILAEGAEIPIVRGDMPDTWIHGPLSDPQGASLARRIRPQIAMAESLNTLLPLWGAAAPDSGRTIHQAYEQSLLYGEHTWGGAYWWIYGNYQAHYGEAWQTERDAGRFDRIQSSWAEHSAYIQHAVDLIEPLLRNQLTALAETVDQDGDRLVVFNPLPWPRRNAVVLADLSQTQTPPPQHGLLRSVPDGLKTPFEIHDNRLRCIVPSIPPSGYQVLSRIDGRLPESSPRRGSPQPEINVRRGTIGSLSVEAILQKAAGTSRTREMVDGNSPFGFGQVLYERFDADQVNAFVKAYVKISSDWATNELGKPMLPPASERPYRASSPENFALSPSPSALGREITLNAPASGVVPFAVTTRYLFYPDLPYFDLEVTLHKKPADPWPEAAWICLPFDVDSPRFRLGRLGSIVDPANDLVPGSNHHLFAIDTGLAIVDPSGRGFGICPLDSPLVSLGEPGCWKYSTEFTPRQATVLINLFNNQWTTNFRLWNEGTWTSRVRIWAFDHYDPIESLIRPSLEARYPLQAVFATGQGGPAPTTDSGIALRLRPHPSPPVNPSDPDPWCHQALITAFAPNPEGPGTLLRLWELAGQSADCEVTLPSNLTATLAHPVNLRGQSIGTPIPVVNHRFITPLKAFAPASYVLVR